MIHWQSSSNLQRKPSDSLKLFHAEKFSGKPEPLLAKLKRILSMSNCVSDMFPKPFRSSENGKSLIALATWSCLT